jgi:hypothetical protein
MRLNFEMVAALLKITADKCAMAGIAEQPCGYLNSGPVAIDLVLSQNELGKAMSDDELKAELERLRNENAALKKGASSSIRMKVSKQSRSTAWGAFP